MKHNFNSELITVLVTLGLGTLAMSILGPVVPLYLTSIGIDPVVLGLMLSVAMVGMAIGESFWGLAADRVGLKPPMLAGTVVCAVSVSLFLLTRNTVALFMIFFFWGFVRAALFGPGRGYVGANAPPLKKATFMALSAVMLSVSRSFAALPSGYMVEYWGYESVFYASAGAALLGGLAVIIGMRKKRAETANEVLKEPVPAGASPCSGGKINFASLTPQCLVAALQFCGLGVMMTFLPLLATQVVGVEIARVGIIFTISGLVNVVLSVPSGMLADRFGKKKLMITGLLISAGAMAGVAYASSFAWLIVFVSLNSIGMVLFSPAALGLLSDSVPLNRQSSAMGIYGGVCENTGVIAGSALGGVIWSALGPAPTFLMSTVTAVLAAIICLTFVKDKAAR